jgi:hypothetical protein
LKRTARCHCGDLWLETDADPDLVVMCHCELCQRRTGTSYNLGAWFSRQAVRISGATQQYIRTGDTQLEAVFTLCPRCGTSLYWEVPAMKPGDIAVAVGCFADPDFPPPTLSLYGKRKHCWLTMPAGITSYAGGWGSEEG